MVGAAIWKAARLMEHYVRIEDCPKGVRMPGHERVERGEEGLAIA